MAAAIARRTSDACIVTWPSPVSGAALPERCGLGSIASRSHAGSDLAVRPRVLAMRDGRVTLELSGEFDLDASVEGQGG
jgi:hypothetical protein